MNSRSLQPPRVWSQWSNRILILSLLGIIYFTCFPFRIDFASPQSRAASPFILGPTLKHGVHFDSFLIVLLFVPFGFVVSAHFRSCVVTKVQVLFRALAARTAPCYAVRLLPFFI